MVKKVTNEKGFTVYYINHQVQMALMNIRTFGNCCDNCNAVIKEVIWVPALNWGMCKECYNDWLNRAKYYEEDRCYENAKISWLENTLLKLGIPVIVSD